MTSPGTLNFFCGKMAAGKYTVAREIVERTGAILHFVDAPDALCKVQLRARSRDLVGGTAWTTDAEFDAITRFFDPPAPDEGFNIVRHERKESVHV